MKLNWWNFISYIKCEEEDRIEAEKIAAHAAWLKDREEKKQAIQAALKAHSAKVPLKGAAALAVQQSGARRASSQSQGESSGTSDVDSPAPPAPQIHSMDMNSTAVSKSPKPESSSPLLTSLLQSPSSIIGLPGDLLTPNSTTRSTSDSHSSPIVVVDSPKQHFMHRISATAGDLDGSQKHSGKIIRRIYPILSI